MPSQCNYTAPPPRIDPDNDITGIGVLINYVATAGIAILVILVYYFVAYEPATDPFNRAQPGSSKDFRPNPVDDLLLCWLRGLFSRDRDRRVDISRKIRREQTFIKCMLAMSDLQLVTGFSVLVSGFVQITSDISTFHFTVIIYLAYFSTVTHLSCLTVLRQYLHTHRFERVARLLGMAVLAIMLIVGLAITSNYPWTAWRDVHIGPRPDLGDLVICYISIGPSSGIDIPFLSMLVSVLLIGIAFISRVIKSHEVLSRRVFGYWQKWLGRQVRKPFRMVYNFTGIQKCAPNSLRRTLFYRPILAPLFMVRAALDVWSSVQFEVGWAAMAFIWGGYRIFLIRPLAAQSGLLTDPSEDDSSDWTYGQVVSVVLLAAPLVTMIGYFDSDIDYEKRVGSIRPAPPLDLQLNLSSTDSLSHPLTLVSPHDYIDDTDHPDNDWAPNRGTLGAAAAYINLELLTICCAAVFYSLWQYTLTPLGAIDYTGVQVARYATCVVFCFTGLHGVILFSLLIEGALANHGRAVRMGLQLFSILWFAATPLLGYTFATDGPGMYTDSLVLFMQPLAYVLYILCALVYRFRGRLKWG